MTNDQDTSNSSVLSNAVKGAAAGALAVWVMDRLDWFLFKHEDQEARHQTESVRPEGLDPAHVTAKRAANMAGIELHPAQPHPAGVATHYALGLGPAMIYAILRHRLPVHKQGQDYLYGLGLGLGLFLIQDEGLNQAMGLSAKQKDYPWQAHGRGLAAHLTFGLVVNTVLNLLDAPRPAPGSRSGADASLRHEAGHESYESHESDALLPMPLTGSPEDQRGILH